MFAPTPNHLEDKGEICLSNILLLSFSDPFFGWCYLNMKVSPKDSYVWTLGLQLMALSGKAVEPLGGRVLVEEVLYWGQALMFIAGFTAKLSLLSARECNVTG